MSIESMTPMRSVGRGSALRVARAPGAPSQTLSAGDLVGPIVSARRPTVSVATAPIDGRISRSGDVDLCRLLVAVLGVGAYLGAPAALLFYAAWKLIA